MHRFESHPEFPGDCRRCPFPANNKRVHGEDADAAALPVRQVAPQPNTGSPVFTRADARLRVNQGTALGDALALIAAADPQRGLTDAELLEAMRGTYSLNTPRARRCDLLNAGLVEQADHDGQPVVRNNFAAWRATPAGVAALESVAA